MMPNTENASVAVEVAVTPKGHSISDGVKFDFSLPPGSTLPSGILSDKGKLNLNKINANGEAVGLEFHLTTPSITFTSGPTVGTFDMSFFGAAHGGKDALLLAEGDNPPGLYNGTEFTGFNLTGGNEYLSVTDCDNDQKKYNYALVVWAHTGPGNSGRRFEDDPKILNTGSH